MKISPLIFADFYKVEHVFMYPENMVKLYSNLTPRKSRIEGINSIVVFGVQAFIKEYLIKQFNENFFARDWSELETEYLRFIPVRSIKHIEKLHKLGYLPLEIKTLEEGSLCPIQVPMLTITNTYDEFGWLVNYLETLMSCQLWQPITSATIAYNYKKILTKYALETTGSTEFVQWQGHDFSMRGISSVESAILSGMGHLTSFTGTDTIPAIYALEHYYNDSGLIGASVPATEHSVMCMGEKESEIKTFERLLDLYPNGILSVVSDTWDLWKVLTEYLPQLKEKILARDGKLVIRPDSGDPVDIICGLSEDFVFEGQKGYWTEDGDFVVEKIISDNEVKGVIELLWDVFGGTVNEQGYKVLDPHIGAIYGDSINLERAKQICERLKAKGFASTNIVLGVGSFTYQYNTRDTFGFAMKATYGEVLEPMKLPSYATHGAMNRVGREIFKDPITDDGTKRSKKGLLRVSTTGLGTVVHDQQTWEQEKTGELKTVFLNGKLIKETSLQDIRNRLSL